jgi:hypothetical protein
VIAKQPEHLPEVIVVLLPLELKPDDPQIRSRQ